MASAVALSVMGMSLPANAQIKMNSAPANVEPQTGLSAGDWLAFETSHAALGAFSNDPWIMVYNATPNAITIKCDDEKNYDLVGGNVYNKQNPQQVAPWSYGPIAVKGWDKYCSGTYLKAYSVTGTAVYQGIMERTGDFTHSRWMAFVAK